MRRGLKPCGGKYEFFMRLKVLGGIMQIWKVMLFRLVTKEAFSIFFGGHWCFQYLIHDDIPPTICQWSIKNLNFTFFTDSCYVWAIFAQGLLRTLIKQIIISGAIMTIKSWLHRKGLKGWSGQFRIFISKCGSDEPLSVLVNLTIQRNQIYKIK